MPIQSTLLKKFYFFNALKMLSTFPHAKTLCTNTICELSIKQEYGRPLYIWSWISLDQMDMVGIIHLMIHQASNGSPTGWLKGRQWRDAGSCFWPVHAMDHVPDANALMRGWIAPQCAAAPALGRLQVMLIKWYLRSFVHGNYPSQHFFVSKILVK